MECKEVGIYQSITNPHGLILQPLQKRSSTPYDCHCEQLSFPHRHKLVIEVYHHPIVFDECRCKPDTLTQDEWTSLLRMRDEYLRDVTIAMLTDNEGCDVVQCIPLTLGRLSPPSKYQHYVKNYNYKSLRMDFDIRFDILNCGSFLQTVATDSIIHLNDWRLMDMIMKPSFNLTLHGNDFLQINSTITKSNKNRTIELLKRTEFSGRQLMVYTNYQYTIQPSVLLHDDNGIIQVPISRANVIKNLLSDDNVDIMSLRRYTFFDDWFTKCEHMHPQQQQRYFADEVGEINDRLAKVISNRSCLSI